MLHWEALPDKLDLSSLYNEDSDFKVKNGDDEYRINVCGGGLKTDCGGEEKASVCLNGNTVVGGSKGEIVARKTSVDYATLVYETDKKCKVDPKVNVSAEFRLTCGENGVTSKPEFYAVAGRCKHRFAWSTPVACPGYREVQCAVKCKTCNHFHFNDLRRKFGTLYLLL